MKPVLWLLAVSGLLSATLGQWLEQTIYVDHGVAELCYIPPGNKVYALSYDYGTVTVIDGASNNVLKVIPVGGHPVPMCYNPTANKVYCSNWADRTVSVIDCATDSVVATLDVNGFLGLCCAPDLNEVYVGGVDTVTVISGASNTVIGWMRTYEYTYCACLCYDSATRKLYCTNAETDNITVFDAGTGNWLATIPNLSGAWKMSLNSALDKLYCVYDQDSSTATKVAVIDCATDSVVKRIRVGTNPYSVYYLASHNRVYVGCEDSYYIYVIDCDTDSVVKTIRLPAYTRPWVFLYNSLNDRLYAGCSGTVLVVDPARDSVVKSLNISGTSDCIAWNPVQNRTYVGNGVGSEVWVFRDSMPGIEESPKPQATSHKLTATIIRGVLELPGDRRPGTRDRAALLDISGRKVAELRPGANDVRALAPGVYFIREEMNAEERDRVTKVIVQH